MYSHTVGRRRKAEPIKTKHDRHGIRDRLARAGAMLFAERGLHGTQVADVARNANVSVGAFYRYFRDKDELFTTLVRDRFAQYDTTLRGLLVALDTATIAGRVAILRGVCRRTLEMHVEDRDMFLLWHRHGNGESNAVVNEFVANTEQLMIEILDRTIVVGNILDEPTRRLVATSMIAVLNSVALRLITNGGDLEHAADVCTRVVGGGLFALAPTELQQTLLATYQHET
jgi:AcrR family transcriptional regulator